MTEKVDANEQLTLPAPDDGVVGLAYSFLKPVARILDAGCGNGRNSIHLAKQGHAVIGIEKDPDLVSEAQMWAPRFGSKALQLIFLQGDIRKLPYTQPSFEAVLATRVLQELSNRRQVQRSLENLQRVTLTGGYNFITNYVGSRRVQESKAGLAILYPGEVKAIYEKCGWDVVHVRQDIKPPLKMHTGEMIIRSFDEIVAQKPTQPAQAKTDIDFGAAGHSEYLRRVDPELYGDV